MISYNNGKGIVEVTICRHAVFQMQDRYQLLFDQKITATQAEQQIVKRFPGCNRLKNFKQVEKSRIKRHPGATLFFRDLDFTFVVQDAKLRSVEISRVGMRHLNKAGKDFTDFKNANSDLFEFTKEEIQEAKEFLKNIPKFPVKLNIKSIRRGRPSTCDEILED